MVLAMPGREQPRIIVRLLTKSHRALLRTRRPHRIGFPLARMELTLIVARLAHRLVPAPTTSTVPEPIGAAIDNPDGGVPMRTRERRTSHERHLPAT